MRNLLEGWTREVEGAIKEFGKEILVIVCYPSHIYIELYTQEILVFFSRP